MRDIWRSRDRQMSRMRGFCIALAVAGCGLAGWTLGNQGMGLQASAPIVAGVFLAVIPSLVAVIFLTSARFGAGKGGQRGKG